MDTDNRGQRVANQTYFWEKCVVRQFTPTEAEYFSIMDLSDVSIRESYGRVKMLNISAQAHHWAGIPDLDPGTVLEVLAWCAQEADQLDLAIQGNKNVDLEAYQIIIGLKPDRPRDSSEAALSAVDWDKDW